MSDAVKFAKQAFQNMSNLGDLAGYIRAEFKKKHGGSWICIVGINEKYGVNSEYTPYIVFKLGNYRIILKPH